MILCGYHRSIYDPSAAISLRDYVDASGAMILGGDVMETGNIPHQGEQIANAVPRSCPMTVDILHLVEMATTIRPWVVITQWIALSLKS